MKLKRCFEIVSIADEFLAVPLGVEANSFSGIVVLSEEAALLLKEMKEAKTLSELTDALMREYDIDQTTAERDVSFFLKEVEALGLVEA